MCGEWASQRIEGFEGKLGRSNLERLGARYSFEFALHSGDEWHRKLEYPALVMISAHVRVSDGPGLDAKIARNQQNIA